MEKYNHINMNKKDLKKLSKSQLINLLLKQSVMKPKIIVVDDTKPVPAPRTYTKQGDQYQHLARVSNRWLKNMKKTLFFHQ